MSKKASAKKGATKPRPRSGKAREEDDDGEYAERSDKATGELAVVEMIAGLKGPARDVSARLHDVVMSAVPDIEPAIKWGMPVYSRGTMICYAAPYDAYVRFGFYDRTGLDGLDAGQGVGGSVKYASAKDVDAAKVAAWVKKAVARGR